MTDSGVLYVGYYTGNGTLSITNGGAANSAGGWIGDSGSGVTSGSGAVAVDGAGSKLDEQRLLYLGYIFGASSATLKITNGGAVKDTLGYGEGACSVRVDGTGSTWTNSGDLNLSYYGSSDTLTIANGGTVSSTDANLGNEETGTVAIASISGAGRKWTCSSNLNVSDNGTLNITTGGGVSDANGSIVGLIFPAVANVAGPGSKLTNSSGLTLYGVATLNVSGGAVVSSVTSSIGFRGTYPTTPGARSSTSTGLARSS